MNISLKKSSDNRHPIFGDKNRFPKKPYFGDAKQFTYIASNIKMALTRKYVQVNNRGAICWTIIDVDRPNSIYAWKEAGLPPPTWTVMNPETGHTHHVWGLSVPVNRKNGKTCRIYKMIRGAMVTLMNGDVAFNETGKTYNPLHPAWEAKFWNSPINKYYTFIELCQHIPPELLKPKKYEKKKEKKGVIQEDFYPIGYRNQGIFDETRTRLYHTRDGLEFYFSCKESGNFKRLYDYVLSEASRINGEKCQVPLKDREIVGIAKSISEWTWEKFLVRRFDKEKFSKIQAARQARSAMKRRESRKPRMEKAKLLMKSLSVEEVAKEVGVSRRTIYRWAKIWREEEGNNVEMDKQEVKEKEEKYRDDIIPMYEPSRVYRKATTDIGIGIKREKKFANDRERKVTWMKIWRKKKKAILKRHLLSLLRFNKRRILNDRTT